MQQQLKNYLFVEGNAMNISAKFQLYPSYSFDLIFYFFFHKFNLVAMATNQIERFGLK